jgi:hypothetical protein
LDQDNATGGAGGGGSVETEQKAVKSKDNAAATPAAAGTVNVTGMEQQSQKPNERNEQIIKSERADTNRMSSEKVFVKEVRGSKAEALTHAKVEYWVKCYTVDSVAETHRNNVKWMVKVDGKYEKLKNIKGEKIKLEMKQEWANKDIHVMAYLDSPREDVCAKTSVRLFYKGTKKWGELQIDSPEGKFSASGHNYTFGEICKLEHDGKKLLNTTWVARLLYLSILAEDIVKSDYEDYPLVGARWVLSLDDDVQNRVIDNFYNHGKKLVFDKNSELSKKLNGYNIFETYYKGYLKVLKKMLEENTLETIDGEEIVKYFVNLDVKPFPNFSHWKDIDEYDYFGLMGNAQTIKVDLEIKQTDIRSYDVTTKMYIGDWYGADFDDINGVNMKGIVPSLNAFFWLQHHFNCYPFETEIILERENTINL